MDLLIKCNVGVRERQIRLLAGIAAAIGVFRVQEPAAKAALGAVGVMGLATGSSRYCPLYHLLGINHCQPAYRSFRQILRRI